MKKERITVMRKLCLLLLFLALIAGCSSQPVCKEGNVETDMVFIPAGEFTMGNNSGDDDEKP
ncbi:MAG: hypothetical protein H8E47_06950, partial [Anaerolineales bacterium]|nr:hypothetical protein [Anaerolineales bacterium]